MAGGAGSAPAGSSVFHRLTESCGAGARRRFSRVRTGGAPAPPNPARGGPLPSGRCRWERRSGSISLYLCDSPLGGCPFFPSGELRRPGEVDCAEWGSRTGIRPGRPACPPPWPWSLRHPGRVSLAARGFRALGTQLAGPRLRFISLTGARRIGAPSPGPGGALFPS